MAWLAVLSMAAPLEVGGACVEPPYEQHRQDEDYAYLAEPACVRSPLDRVKWIALGDERGLTLGADVRERYEYVSHRDWGAESDGYLLQRYMLHADARAPAIRAFLQLKSALSSGQEAPRPSDRDRADTHQLFLDWSPASYVTRVRVGRQELAFGSGRLFSVREGPNVRRSFDGLRISAAAAVWTIDAFGMRPVETDPGTFDDDVEQGQRTWGVYAVRPGLDLYYFGLRRQEATFEQGTATELRHSAGARFWAAPKSGWGYNVEAVVQGGSFAGGDIAAWTLASEFSYRFREPTGALRLGTRANLTSGDHDPADTDLQTFNPLFPRGNYFGEAALIGPLNHVDVHPFVEVALSAAASLSFDWDFFWRQSTADGLYRASGTLLFPGSGSAARYVGHQPGIGASWAATRHLDIEASYSYFFRGDFLKEVGASSDLSFTAVWANWRI